MKNSCFIVLFCLLMNGPFVEAGLIYSNNFDGSETFTSRASGGLSGVTTTELTTLTLNGLPTHTSISLDFLLAIIDSWDGSSTAGNVNSIPDLFNVRVHCAVPALTNYLRIGLAGHRMWAARQVGGASIT